MVKKRQQSSLNLVEVLILFYLKNLMKTNFCTKGSNSREISFKIESADNDTC